MDKLDEPPIFRIARLQFEATRNILWPLWMLSLRSQGDLPPPRWVWEFLLSLSNFVWDGAAAHRHPDETVEDTKFNDQSLLEALGLKKTTGKKDRFVEFRQTLTDVFLALDAEELRSSGIKLIEACKQIAKQQGIETTNKAFKKYNWRYVYTAHHRWFMADGRMRLRPGARNPRKSVSRSTRSAKVR